MARSVLLPYIYGLDLSKNNFSVNDLRDDFVVFHRQTFFPLEQ